MLISAHLHRLTRYVAGRDFFISYTRRDAAPYAARLARILGEKHTVYLDQLDTPQGAELPPRLVRALQVSTALIVVGSPAAVVSTWLHRELELFATTDRPVLFIDVENALAGAPWTQPPWSKFSGVYRQPESRVAFESPNVSEDVLLWLRDQFIYTKQTTRLRRAVVATLTVLGAAALASVVLVSTAQRRAAKAESDAAVSSQRADEAARQERAAARRENEATDRARAADARAEDAERLETAARERAVEQQQIAIQAREAALALDLANEATAAMTEPHLLERSALLSLESLRRVHLPENDASLRRALALLPRSVALRRHPQRVSSLAVSASGRMFATGAGDGVTRVFGLPEATPIVEGRQAAQVVGLAFNPEDTIVVSGSADGSIRAFEVPSGKERWIARGSGRVAAVSISGDGRFVAVGTDKQEVVVLNLLSGQTTWRTTTDGFVSTVAFSPDSRLLAAGGGGTLHVFDASSGLMIRSGKEPAFSAAFSPDGRQLAAVGDKVNVLAVGTWTSEASLDAAHPQAYVAFAPDTRWLASAGTDGIVHIWHLGDRREAARFALGVQSVPSWLAFSPDGRTLASGWWDKTVRILDATSAVERWRVGHDGFVLKGAFTPNGRYLITAGDDGVARVSEPRDESVAVLGLPYASVPPVVSRDGRHVATVREDRMLRLIDRYSGATLVETSIPGQTTALKFMPDGRHVVLAIRDKGVRLLNAETGNIVWEVPVRGQVDGMDVSPRGTSVAFGSWMGELRMLDAGSGATVWTTNAAERLSGVVFSGDGNRLAVVGALLESRVLDAPTGAVVWRGNIRLTSAAALNHDGRLLALALADQSVRVYELQRNREVLRLTTRGLVVALALSRDARRLAIGGNDRNARVFDIDSGSERIRIPHDADVWALGFTSDGQLWTTQGFNIVRWHAADADMLAAEACSKLSRSLTREEWMRYLGNEPYRAQCGGTKDPLKNKLFTPS